MRAHGVPGKEPAGRPGRGAPGAGLSLRTRDSPDEGSRVVPGHLHRSAPAGSGLPRAHRLLKRRRRPPRPAPPGLATRARAWQRPGLCRRSQLSHLGARRAQTSRPLQGAAPRGPAGDGAGDPGPAMLPGPLLASVSALSGGWGRGGQPQPRQDGLGCGKAEALCKPGRRRGKGGAGRALGTPRPRTASAGPGPPRAVLSSLQS